MKEYEIKKEPVTLGDGTKKDKWNIYYYIDGVEQTKMFYSYDGINAELEIEKGYTPRAGSIVGKDEQIILSEKIIEALNEKYVLTPKVK